ncbi:MAG TPA: biopolymer transporter ExbD [Polyangiaceae bacterium]|nr:biopolymer transporter ExbD [Polyangiaceae bacterium]
MAHASSHNDEPISGINVTPLVDVVLVLLVVMMVTATYIASRSIPVDLPSGKTGEAAQAPLAISVDKSGALYLDGTKVDEPSLRTRLAAARSKNKELRAVIAADGSVAHRQVVRVIDLLRQEHIVRFGINVNPDDLKPATR